MTVSGDDDVRTGSGPDPADGLTADALVGSLSEQLDAVVSAAAELLHVECVGLLLLDDADRVRCVAATGPAAEVLERAQERIAVGPGIDALGDRGIVAVTDLADEPRYAPLWREVAGHGVRAVLAAPIRLDDQVVGNLNALDPQPHPWSAAQQRSAETMAGIVGQLLGLAAHIDVPGDVPGDVPDPEQNGREPVP